MTASTPDSSRALVRREMRVGEGEAPVLLIVKCGRCKGREAAWAWVGQFGKVWVCTSREAFVSPQNPSPQSPTGTERWRRHRQDQQDAIDGARERGTRFVPAVDMSAKVLDAAAPMVAYCEKHGELRAGEVDPRDLDSTRTIIRTALPVRG